MNRTFSRVAMLVAAAEGVVMTAPQAQPPSFVAATNTVAVYATGTSAGAPHPGLVAGRLRGEGAIRCGL